MNKRLITTAVAVAAATTQIFATEGINLIGIGPVQQGTAGAGVASAKDSTWLILNPAGLTDLTPRADASLQVFAPYRTMNSSTSGGAYQQNDDSSFVIPSISSSFGCCHGENGFVGVGIYGTSGMGVDYDYGRFGADTNGDGMPDRPQSFGDTRTELAIAKMTATYAYRVPDSGFSIGAGPIFVLSRFRTDMLDQNRNFASDDWETSYGVGAIVGVNQHLGRWSLGASYMSEQYMTTFDDYDNTLLNKPLNLPQQLTAGVAVNVMDNIELVCDYRWLVWSDLDTFGDQFGWDDQHIIKAGITWGVTDALTLRSGISYGNSPIDGSNAFSNALFPAIMETHAAFGASYAWEKWEASLAYIHAFDKEVSATANDANTGPFGYGTTISMYQNSLTAGVSYNF